MIEYNENEIENANNKIAELLQAAHASIKEAESVANKYKLDFTFRVVYGMGGFYTGDDDARSEDDDNGWMASSESC